MSIYIENKYQGTIEVDYQAIITSVINASVDFVQCPFPCEVNVTITDDEEIRQLNKNFREIDRSTDVLSFPLLTYTKPGDFSSLVKDYTSFHPETGELLLGDIVISYDKVISQAKEYNHSQKRELAFLTAHSMLHLFGFDHIEKEERKVMETKQDTILQNLGITREN